MRKQDRIAREQQNRGEGQQAPEPQPEPREREQIKGTASADQPARPSREPGKMPLPD